MASEEEKRERRLHAYRKYEAANKERRREGRRRYRENNKEKRADAGKRYRQENADKIRAWVEANRDHVAQYQRKYRAVNRETIRKRRSGRQREYIKRARQDPELAARRRAAQARWRAANSAKMQESTRLRKHGLSTTAWAAMLASQGGCCYLCNRELDPAVAVIDHDHRCCPPGRSCSTCQRGLACGPCNTLIGFADDDPDRLILIAENLRPATARAGERMQRRPIQEELFPA